ncbi:MAG: TerC family protein [Planctomycetes bacterium]|nr:TerC family protein [Planctomycetota bacterium]
MGSTWLYASFTAFVALMLVIDLGVFHRKAHAVSVRESLSWTGVWVGLALLFNAGLWIWRGPEAGVQFLTGYLVEKSLSVDNMFVFLIVFSYFAVPRDLQHKVLFWGIIGAVLLRAVMIAAGAALLANFHWVIYVFGGFLILTAVKLALQKEESLRPECNPVVRIFRRLMPVTDAFEGGRFFTRRAGKLVATPLFLVLLTVEFTDLVFAVDSIPAIFAITPDPFIVYTSNIFAILGLRSLYFALSGVIGLFTYLKPALALVMGFVGVKMVCSDFLKISPLVSLGVIFGILAAAVALSLLRPRRPAPAPLGAKGELR